ncbi:MAG TPA: hypothetical protein VGD17_06725, partial [Chitinophagaceae bacterium]
MPVAGYSGKPLLQKLGIGPVTKLLVINAPADYFQLLEKDVSGQYADKNEVPDLVHLFVKNNREFQKEMIGL